jgi:small Trp-rich protein
MPMLLLGVLLLAAKVLDLGPLGALPWWLVLTPFGLAAVWWKFADSTGLTRKRAMQKMEDRKRERRERQIEALGMDAKRQRQLDKVREEARRRAAQGGEPPPENRP